MSNSARDSRWSTFSVEITILIQELRRATLRIGMMPSFTGISTVFPIYSDCIKNVFLEAKRFGMDTEMNFRTIMFHFKKGLYTDMTPSEALPKLQEHVAKTFPKLVRKNRIDIINEYYSRRPPKLFPIAGYLAK